MDMPDISATSTLYNDNTVKTRKSQNYIAYLFKLQFNKSPVTELTLMIHGLAKKERNEVK